MVKFRYVLPLDFWIMNFVFFKFNLFKTSFSPIEAETPCFAKPSPDTKAPNITPSREGSNAVHFE